MSNGFNVSEWLVDRHVREGRGGRTAVRDNGRSVSYRELLELIASAAGALGALDVRPEERVLLIMLDSVEFVAAFLGAARLGAVPVPVNPLLAGRDLAEVAADARARVAVLSPQRAAVIPDLVAGAAELAHLLVTGDDQVASVSRVTVHGWDAALARAPGVAAYSTGEDSPGFWLCTSGTTGRPKLAMHRHIDARLVAESYAAEILAAGEDDRFYSVAPMFHAYGLGNSLVFPLAVGATTILVPTRPPTPELVARVVKAERPTLFFSVPTSYGALLAAELAPDTFDSVRLAASAGEALPGGLLQRFRDRFGVEILDGIGSTEMTHIFISNRPGKTMPGASGTPVPGYRARLVDDDDGEVGPDTPGQLLVSGSSAATGYWCRTEATRRTFVGAWVRTGDMYTRSADDVYRYLGRTDDLFKVAGEWVSPYEVEAVLVSQPDVLEAAVVPVITADGLHRPVALVVAASGCGVDVDALVELCRARLPGFKRPQRIRVVDQLPKTATGKIQRRLVRQLAGG